MGNCIVRRGGIIPALTTLLAVFVAHREGSIIAGGQGLLRWKGILDIDYRGWSQHRLDHMRGNQGDDLLVMWVLAIDLAPSGCLILQTTRAREMGLLGCCRAVREFHRGLIDSRLRRLSKLDACYTVLHAGNLFLSRNQL